eukprot:scaffold207_cov409-Prasinococcus_capsulatus_cf.AAC.91
MAAGTDGPHPLLMLPIVAALPAGSAARSGGASSPVFAGGGGGRSRLDCSPQHVAAPVGSLRGPLRGAAYKTQALCARLVQCWCLRSRRVFPQWQAARAFRCLCRSDRGPVGDDEALAALCAYLGAPQRPSCC